MSRRVFFFGEACLILGWVGSGWLEWSSAPFWVDALVLIILTLVVAASADHVK